MNVGSKPCTLHLSSPKKKIGINIFLKIQSANTTRGSCPRKSAKDGGSPPFQHQVAHLSEGPTREEAKARNTPSTASASSAVPTLAPSKTTCGKEPLWLCESQLTHKVCGFAAPVLIAMTSRHLPVSSSGYVASLSARARASTAPSNIRRIGEVPQRWTVHTSERGQLSTPEAREVLSEHFDPPLIRGSDAYVHVPQERIVSHACSTFPTRGWPLAFPKFWPRWSPPEAFTVKTLPCSLLVGRATLLPWSSPPRLGPDHAHSCVLQMPPPPPVPHGLLFRRGWHQRVPSLHPLLPLLLPRVAGGGSTGQSNRIVRAFGM